MKGHRTGLTPITRFRRCLAGLRPTRDPCPSTRSLVICLVATTALTMTLCIAVTLSLYWKVQTTVRVAKSRMEQGMDFLQNKAEAGPLTDPRNVLKLLFNHVERLHTVSDPDTPGITQASWDLSSLGQSFYIFKHFRASKCFKEKKLSLQRKLVFDIGAADGMMGSNSRFFLPLGFRAVLVEPQDSMLKHLRRAYSNTYWKLYNQERNVVIVPAAVDSKQSGVLCILGEVQTSTKVAKSREACKALGGTVQTKSRLLSFEAAVELADAEFRTKMTFGPHSNIMMKLPREQWSIPKDFFLLSIDAEGKDLEILSRVIELGYRPLYIIVESNRGGWKVVDLVNAKVRHKEALDVLGPDYELIGEIDSDLMFVHTKGC